MMKQRTNKGVVLAVVVSIILVLTVIGLGVLSLAHSEAVTTQRQINKLKAFYLAEAGIAQLTIKFREGDLTSIESTTCGPGTYAVQYVSDVNQPYAIATGKVGAISQRLQVTPTFLSGVYEHAMYAANGAKGPFTFMLRGTGDPVRSRSGEVGGSDIINGNVYANGDVRLYGDSSVNAAPWPNTYGLMGNVDATGTIETLDHSSIAGVRQDNADPIAPPDLVAMDYAHNNTYNVSQVFAQDGVDSGRLPTSSPLTDIVVKNPIDRSSECASTTGDDYFLEPAQISSAGTQWDAATPLDLGQKRVYYIDGDVWVDSKYTYGFKVKGNVTIVATGNIHISDNIEYADNQSVLGLVALGKYTAGSDVPVSGGNIYFGDPRYGTTYTVSALMFAANNFLYNTDSVTGGMQEPTTGFIVNGNFSARNHISVERDWYTKTTSTSGGGTRQTTEARAAHYDTATNTWVDLETGGTLTSQEIGTIRHYRMKVNYDDRVRSIDTQPPELPQGPSGIFSGFTQWRELP